MALAVARSAKREKPPLVTLERDSLPTARARAYKQSAFRTVSERHLETCGRPAPLLPVVHQFSEGQEGADLPPFSSREAGSDEE